jgi:hypothetical protein
MNDPSMIHKSWKLYLTIFEDKYVVDYPIDEPKTELKLKLKSHTVIMKILLTPLMIISYQ